MAWQIEMFRRDNPWRGVRSTLGDSDAVLRLVTRVGRKDCGKRVRVLPPPETDVRILEQISRLGGIIVSRPI